MDWNLVKRLVEFTEGGLRRINSYRPEVDAMKFEKARIVLLLMAVGLVLLVVKQQKWDSLRPEKSIVMRSGGRAP